MYVLSRTILIFGGAIISGELITLAKGSIKRLMCSDNGLFMARFAHISDRKYVIAEPHTITKKSFNISYL